MMKVMGKTTVRASHRLRRLALHASLLVLSLVALGCSGRTTLETPLARFEPPEGSLFRITFDFPSTWALISRGPVQNRETIAVDDPSKPTELPGSEPNFEVGIIIIRVTVVDPEASQVDSQAQSLLETTRNIPQMSVLGDRSLTIDGYPARWIARRIEPRPALGQMIVTVDEMVFLQVVDRFYILSLSLPESEREGEFGRGFDALIASIKVIE